MLLSPVGWLYGKIADIRNTLYERGVLRSYSLGAKTISIGNITAGGTGKTPLVAYVAEILADSGEKVCILTRGYGRDNPRERVLVSDGEQVLVDARTGGDEPVELARKLIGKAIIVADADRVSAAAWAKEKFGVTAFLLDDGFQHRRVRRDLEIVCVDATNPFGGSRMLPTGRLREPSKNLGRADAVVITRSDLVDSQRRSMVAALTGLAEFVPSTKEELDRWYDDAEQFKTDHLLSGPAARYVPHSLWHYLSDADIRMKDETYADLQNDQVNLLLKNRSADEIVEEIREHTPSTRIFVTRTETARLRSLSEFEIDDPESSWKVSKRGDDAELRVLAFCALGNPEAFFGHLSLASKDNLDLALSWTFPDHHQYTQSDISMLEEKARPAGAEAFLTTAKDAVKLSGFKFELPCYVVEIEIKLDDPDGFRDLVLSA